MTTEQNSEPELAALAEASRERAGLAPAQPGTPIGATLDDVLRAAERARAASEASGREWAPESVERRRELIPVLERLPFAMRGLTRPELERLIDPKLLGAVLSWRWGSGNLLLAGRTRVGKTSAAVHLVRRLVWEGAQRGGEAFEMAKLIRWQECRELSASARDYKRGIGSPEDVNACKLARLLVLDDLGAHDEREGLERILQFRLTRGWPTITTTGLHVDGPQGLDATFGEHFGARLLELGADKGTTVECFGGADV